MLEYSNTIDISHPSSPASAPSATQTALLRHQRPPRCVPLPIELIQHVLISLFGDPNPEVFAANNDSLLAASQVCRLWRTAAWGCRYLWTFVDIAWTQARLQMWLDRSGDKGINAYFHERPPMLQEAVVYTIFRPCQTMSTYLSTYSHRVVTFYAEPLFFPRADAIRLILNKQSFPIMSKLTLVFEENGCESVIGLASHRFPSLQTIEASGQLLVIPSDDMPTISEVHLIGQMYETDEHDLIRHISPFKNLKLLDLCIDFVPGSFHHHEIQLPRLEVLVARALEPEFLVAFSELVQMPVLRSLAIQFFKYRRDDFIRFVSTESHAPVICSTIDSCSQSLDQKHK